MLVILWGEVNGFKIVCIDGVRYLENGSRLSNSYNLTAKFNKNGQVETCQEGVK